jgi:hypothetical protein
MLFYTYYTPYYTYLIRMYTYLFGHLIRFGTTLIIRVTVTILVQIGIIQAFVIR